MLLEAGRGPRTPCGVRRMRRMRRLPLGAGRRAPGGFPRPVPDLQACCLVGIRPSIGAGTGAGAEPAGEERARGAGCAYASSLVAMPACPTGFQDQPPDCRAVSSVCAAWNRNGAAEALPAV